MDVLLSLILLILCLHEEILANSGQSPVRNNRKGRLVIIDEHVSLGKNNVDIKDYPWMVSVLERNFHTNKFHPICGGSLLTTNFVATAHHCLPDNQNPEILSVRSGSAHSQRGGFIHSVIEMNPHPQGYDVRYDLAILKIYPKVRFLGGNNLPIQIFIGKVNPGTSGLILGWGYANLIPPRPVNFLRKAEVTLMGKDYCEKFTGRGDFLLCSSTTDAGVCSGDSGGPLVIEGQLAGVISAGGCESPSHANSFVNISYHREWIENIIEPNYIQ